MMIPVLLTQCILEIWNSLLNFLFYIGDPKLGFLECKSPKIEKVQVLKIHKRSNIKKALIDH